MLLIVGCMFDIFVLALYADLCNASTASLPSYPLAVKNPYLSTWVPGYQMNDSAHAQPEFWAGQPLTWIVLARVNGKTYSLFGNPDGVGHTAAATTESVSFTSSHTFVNLTAGAAKVTLDFFSPVLPRKEDYVRQSLPYSYLTVTAAPYGDEEIDVQIFSAIDHTWTAQHGAASLNYSSYGSAEYFQFYNPSQIPYTEVNDMATYGSVLFGTMSDDGVTHRCAPEHITVNQFDTGGQLADSDVSCSGLDLVALSKDLGNVRKNSTAGVTFAVGRDRKEAINYLGNTQTGLYRSVWSTEAEAIEYFLQDYESAYNTSLSFDAEVRSRSRSVSNAFGDKYADIVEASVRQTFGAYRLVLPADDLGAPPQAFIKEISSDGNLNTVDIIFQTWPVFISLNPDYIRLLWEPIMSYSASGRWPKEFVIHDMGTHYPNATGHDDGREEHMPLFETSSLFILFYAYEKYTGDASWAKQYSSYADYLVDHSLYPSAQLISVDAIRGYANQTALAVQSAMGLKAASKILHNDTHAEVGDSYASKIYDEALGLDGPTVQESTHFTYYYDQEDTWNVIFAAYSDVLLELDTFPSAAWDMQSEWYLRQIRELGLPFAGPSDNLDYTGSKLTWGLSDWNIVAASASSTAVQAAVIDTTHAFLTNGMNDIPFGTKYEVQGPRVGKWISNRARSTVGSNFALVALKEGTWW
ncbi:DUF1793-domain-containing protein [Hortaea werneckii]|nr:DUF1793-domain-containing protein [Hortaea werneckii]KAI6826639.1 DUF1793-domain-containing protein [Hortaea werneckii]KAI6923200.1 DUF1793-domain-containing protein [Hortaea werneckii]KAI6932297.1 DUF1793-domain-containing protein [Hortaea werneckii]KAI6966787.1 DUF1793-domain-containing protein [Hortaea werneckii]